MGQKCNTQFLEMYNNCSIITTTQEFCLSCEPGTFQDEAGQAFCKNCSTGFYCKGETTENPCGKERGPNFYLTIKKFVTKDFSDKDFSLKSPEIR